MSRICPVSANGDLAWTDPAYSFTHPHQPRTAFNLVMLKPQPILASCQDGFPEEAFRLSLGIDALLSALAASDAPHKGSDRRGLNAERNRNMKTYHNINAPWTLHFDRDGTEDIAIICDSNGYDLATSRHFWLPEGDDPVPPTLSGMQLMAAAPNLLALLKKLAHQPKSRFLKELDNWRREARAALVEAGQVAR